MDIHNPTIQSVLEEYAQQQREIDRAQDKADLHILRAELIQFNNLYAKNFNSDICRQANRLIIDHIKKRIAEIEHRLYPNTANPQRVRYRLGGDK